MVGRSSRSHPPSCSQFSAERSWKVLLSTVAQAVTMVHIMERVQLPDGSLRAEVGEEYRDWYHGAHAHLIPSIIANGLMPSCDTAAGAGQGALCERFGTYVPVVYCAPSWKEALGYPLYSTTGPVSIPGQKKMSDISGGSLLAFGGSAPFRAMVRFIAPVERRLLGKFQQIPVCIPSRRLFYHAYLFVCSPSAIGPS